MGATKSVLKVKRPKRVDRRKTTSTRITPELRAKLDAAAEQSERSLAQEVEIRLERSFQIEDAAGGAELVGLAQMMAGAKVLIEKQKGKSCFSDWDTWLAVQSAWENLFDYFGPDDPQDISEIPYLIDSLGPPPVRPEFPKDPGTRNVLLVHETHRKAMENFRRRTAEHARELSVLLDREKVFIDRLDAADDIGKEVADQSWANEVKKT